MSNVLYPGARNVLRPAIFARVAGSTKYRTDDNATGLQLMSKNPVAETSHPCEPASEFAKPTDVAGAFGFAIDGRSFVPLRSPFKSMPVTNGDETLPDRSEEHTSELQSRFGISYAVFCLKKKK